MRSTTQAQASSVSFGAFTPVKPLKLPQTDMEAKLQETLAKISSRRLDPRRLQPRLKVLEALSDGESDGPELFTAIPSDDIPHNKLTEQLARGL